MHLVKCPGQRIHIKYIGKWEVLGHGLGLLPTLLLVKTKMFLNSEAMLQFEQQVEMMDAVFKRYFQRLSFSFLFLEQLNYVLENAYLQDQTENLTS